MLFSLENEKLDNPVQNSVTGTPGRVLFSKERVRTENISVKNSVNGTEVQCYFTENRETRTYLGEK